ncbi:histidine kinase, partial [Streptomyces sp. NPDC049577]
PVPPAPAAGSGNGAARPKLPARGAASWGNDQNQGGRQAPVDDWPVASQGPARAAQDAPRGHEDVDGGFPAARQGNSGTGQFARPANPAPAAGPGDTSQFPAVAPAPGRGPGDTAQFPPVPADPQNSTTGQFPQAAPGGQQNSTTGQFSTGQFPQAAAGDRQNSPQNGPQYGQQGGRQGGRSNNSTTGQFELPSGPTGTGQFELPGSVGQPQQPQQPQGQAGTPLFEELESHWFRGADESAVPEQPAGSEHRLPRRVPGPTPTPGDGPQSHAVRQDRPRPETPAPGRQQGPAAPTAPSPTQGEWRETANDERWRRAEQVREPAAGGKTSSGLPRRVPRANLVDGTAQQEPSIPAGPQVSRAPDDVRGRLTNLRRGIQQGRQAGSGSTTGSHPAGPTYQQER